MSHLSATYATKRRRRNSKSSGRVNGSSVTVGSAVSLKEVHLGLTNCSNTSPVPPQASQVTPVSTTNGGGNGGLGVLGSLGATAASLSSPLLGAPTTLSTSVSGQSGTGGSLGGGGGQQTQTKSNPSKRHRERLNAELDSLASLLPFDQSVLSKLDKLSILRLSVSYLRTKSYFQASQALSGHHHSKSRDLMYLESLIEGDLILQQALNGFLLILTCDGEVFFASHTVETYLGFHQSDICHQSVYELVHSEDREELQRLLMWNSQLPADRANISVQHMLQSSELHRHLDRNFTVRFRCLLDNTSGFLRLDIQGRIKVLHGQNHKTEDPPLALFALCTPFGPPSLLEMPQKESMFKSKHKLDLSLVSMDSRGKALLGLTDQDIGAMRGGYDLVHPDDLAYVASAHQELLKTGASGLIAYRLSANSENNGTSSWQWLQTSTRLVYKNSKPDFILCTHRPLMEEEGRDLLGKRTMDFKVTYLDTGLNQLLAGSISSPDSPPLPDCTTVVNSNGCNNGTTRIISNDSASSEKPRRKYKKDSAGNNNNNNNNHHHHHHHHHAMLGSHAPSSGGGSKKRSNKNPHSPDSCAPPPMTPMAMTAAAMQLPTAATAYHLSGVSTMDHSDPAAYNASMYPSPYTHPELGGYTAATQANFLFDNSRSFLTAPADFLHYRHHPLSGYYPTSDYPPPPQHYSPFPGNAATYEHSKETLDTPPGIAGHGKYQHDSPPASSPYHHHQHTSPLLVQPTPGHAHLPTLLPTGTTEPIRVKSPASPLTLDSTRQSVLMWGRGGGVGMGVGVGMTVGGVGGMAHQLSVGGMTPQPAVGMYGVSMEVSSPGHTAVELAPPPAAYTADMVSGGPGMSETTVGVGVGWHHHQEVTTAPWRPHLPAALG
ncbi:single-minded homolog 2-like isoform X3 [Varroa jacobsoni]|uniref:single-minded homolog 2-like isoform X3 n=1 Tax=Varroa jacobsoni TaxID=62625 RepID=UPI000BF8024C|nr:single-minded homolog 2-like isoform X3 [Varroa jacobsoni]